jgi:glycosyltransferase involved in cell wall biosynthesis
MKAPLSVFIMTLNEQSNLARCVESVRWADDIHVLDSFSTDETCELAERLGCQVIQRPFLNYSDHLNWGHANIPFNHSWVLQLDADEVVPDDLAQEIRQAVTSPSENVAFRFRRKDYFLGTWLKHASFYPLWLTRLYRPERVTYQRSVHQFAVVNGPVGELQEHLVHYPFSKGAAQWFERHNQYSTFEAGEYVRRDGAPLSWLFHSDVNDRRRARKTLFTRLPGKPLIRFFYLYFLHLGFLDGRAGFYYSLMQACYEFMTSVKVVEAREAA